MPRRLPTAVAACLSAMLLVAACGSDSSSKGASTATEASTPPSLQTLAPAPTTTNPNKPKVSIPATLPTELKVTELRAGHGDKAADKDVVVVNYVGVRSADGTEFDNSWDRGQPFDVQLGAGMVIKGWDEGLVGTQAGGQYQLDIPADLAYGDNPPGSPIKAGDALTFVVDVLAVIHPSEAADAPDVTVGTSKGAKEVTTEDLTPGTGEEAAAGDTVFIDILAFRGDTGEQIDSSFGKGGPFPLQLTKDSSIPGLVTGIPGMKVGGVRKIVIPAADAFGEEGSKEVGLPPNTDLVMVVKLAALYSDSTGS